MDSIKLKTKVSKEDIGHQIIGGWFSVFEVNGDEVVDTDNEVIDIQSYAKCAIDFARNSRTANINHSNDVPPVGYLIDNLCIDSVEFAKTIVHEITGIPHDDIPVQKLGHFGSFQIDDSELFSEMRELGAMFSIEGSCIRTVEDE